MKLNIVTAAANKVGAAIIKEVATSDDITIAFSRRGTNFPNALNIKVTDLANLDTTKRELQAVLEKINPADVEQINLFHNCCYAVCEVPNLQEKYPQHASNPKLVSEDLDGDGIDDRSYHAILTTFRNVLSLILMKYPNKDISLGTICSLTDKKSYEPTVFRSMVRSNKILRNDLHDLVIHNKNIQAVCVSASTVRTDTEEQFRPYSIDKEYWVSGSAVAETLAAETSEHRNVFKDVDLYVRNPRYNQEFKDETDDELTERLKREIGII